MLSSLTMRSKSVVIVALAYAAICLAASDVAVHKTVAPAIEERRLIIRSGTLFTKDGVPMLGVSCVLFGLHPSGSGVH